MKSKLLKITDICIGIKTITDVICHLSHIHFLPGLLASLVVYFLAGTLKPKTSHLTHCTFFIIHIVQALIYGLSIPSLLLLFGECYFLSRHHGHLFPNYKQILLRIKKYRKVFEWLSIVLIINCIY